MKEKILHNLNNAAAVIMGAVGYLAHYRKALARVLLFPFAALGVLNLLIYLVPEDNGFVAWALVALGFLLCSVIAVSIHRMLILGTESLPEWGLIKPSTRELRFAVYLFGIIVLGRLAMAPLALLIYLPRTWLANINVIAVSVVWVLLIGFLFSRLYLIFPGTAVDRDMSLRDSWNLTRPHALMVLIVGVLVPEVSFLAIDFLWDLPVIRYLDIFLLLAWLGFTVAMLSAAYKLIMDSPSGERWARSGEE